MSAGVTTLPFDFDIFLRSGSTMKPEIAAFVHGATPSSSCERSRVENSQVRMMSWPCGRRSNGATVRKSSGSSTQPPASCGVSEEVIQVSITSCSPMKPPAWPRCTSSKPGAGSDDGSTGRLSSDGRIGSSNTGLPSRSSGYQTGIGTPKKRWREISQSPVRPLTQFS